MQARGSTTIVQLNESEVFASHSGGAGPSSNLNDMVDIVFKLGVQSMDSNTLTVRKYSEWLLLNWCVSLEFKFDFTFVASVRRSDKIFGFFSSLFSVLS